MSTPNLGLTTVPANSLQPSIPINDTLQLIDALLHLAVIDKDTTAPPATLTGDVGKRWIIPAGASGVWAGKTGQIALCTAAGVWRYIVPKEGFSAWVIDEVAEYRYIAGAWYTSGS